MKEVCPCGSQVEYDQCCAVFHRGEQWPANPEQCMRSRYSAYVKQNIDYIKATQSPSRREEINWEDTKNWAKNAQWERLEIISSNDQQVEFIAFYKMDGKQVRHHEISNFVFRDEKWYFDDGHIVNPGTIKREGEKIGRNDLCPCGSGKKYKKCCLNK